MPTPVKSVQAKDADSVVEFYTNRGIPAFSVRQGNQLIYAYEGESLEEGAALLGDFVEKFIAIPQSAAIYTLCVHVEPKGPISNKTDYNGSINFRLFDYADMYGAPGRAPTGFPALPPSLESKINGLVTTVQELQKKVDVPKEPDNKLGMVGEILDHPLGFAIGKAIIEKVFKTTVPEPAMISGTGPETDSHQRLNDALVVLIEADPSVPDYLYKLACIAQQDRPKFQGFINMLKMVL